MKVLFLDVDGVLNNEDWADRMELNYGILVYKNNILYQPSLISLRRIINETGAKIVVSSSWRKIPSAYADLLRWLHMYGMEVFDTTPQHFSRSMHIRGDDIEEWLKAHPEVEAYAILDDDDDMGQHMSHLVQTNMFAGLTMMEADECIHMLNGGDNVGRQLYGDDCESDGSERGNERIGRR